MAKTATLLPDGIDPEKTYRLADFMQLSGMGTHAMREARRSGLRVRRAGRLGFVYGRDFIEWLLSRDLEAAEAGERP
jgi:hypothetical protein